MSVAESLNLIEHCVQRRSQLLASLKPCSAVLVASGHEQIRNRDVEFAFRPQSDFYYLTGFSEPDAVLLLVKLADGSARSHVFLRPKDAEQETWQGRRLGVDLAAEHLQVDQAWSFYNWVQNVPKQIESCQMIYVSFSQLSDWTAHLTTWIGQAKQKVRKGIEAPTQICDLDVVLHEMRLHKTADEIAQMRTAARISVAGHLAAMKTVQVGMPEYAVQASLEAEFMRLGAPRVAFNSIVAAGQNACILHYTENRAYIQANDLVLVDAGAEWQGYAGDITTTFPASGEFSPAQAQLYSLVLRAQQAAIAVIKPGVSYDLLHQTVLQIITTGLVELNILQGDVATLIESEAYKPFFMHGTGHWLGMDVHDVGLYKHAGVWRTLQPGMVVTVEPGLYIGSQHTEVDAKWHNIGIRIEDDVLVTQVGHEVLTKGLPRTVAEIEAWMQSR
ncbi:aminopeptidase P N-terminal domain-containing protein [Thiomicrorhabdus aquaedulcis]|uniref:aminopeptidase P N-terminal domain-containing protein n=1 Tax=Thiomicrorhabdus aquaedulcis TaxID=2211106 RepID=UPI000FD95A9C|nr:aminopeptidase P N-terminal domain-containing protein [Thiomicrorhabdus aquaedulcis]